MLLVDEFHAVKVWSLGGGEGMGIPCGQPLFTCTSPPCTTCLSLNQKWEVGRQCRNLLYRVFWRRERRGIQWTRKITFLKSKERQGKSVFHSPNLCTFFFFSCHITSEVWLLRKGVGKKQRKIFSELLAVLLSLTHGRTAAPPCVSLHPRLLALWASILLFSPCLSSSSVLGTPHLLPSLCPIEALALATPPAWLMGSVLLVCVGPETVTPCAFSHGSISPSGGRRWGEWNVCT